MLRDPVPQALRDRTAVADNTTSVEDDWGWRRLAGRSHVLGRGLTLGRQDRLGGRTLTPDVPIEGGDCTGVLVRRQRRANPACQCQARLHLGVALRFVGFKR